MSTDRPPPRRPNSEPTLVLDLDKRITTAARKAFIAAIDNGESPPVAIEDMPETRVRCPICERCKACGGTHLVAQDERSAMLKKEAGL